MLNRRDFIVESASIAAYAVGAPLVRAYSDKANPKVDDLLMCQWVSAIDDDTEIDDSADVDFVTWFTRPSIGKIKDDIIEREGSHVKSLRSCMAGLGFYLASILHAGQEKAYYENKASIQIIQNGHFTSAAAQNVYQAALDNNSKYEAFWYKVATTSPKGNVLGDKSENNALNSDLDWQTGANHKSLENARKWWMADPGKRWNKMAFVYYLMLGQRHEDGREAAHRYRAVFRDSPAELFARVNNRLG